MLQTPELRASFHAPVASREPHVPTFNPKILGQVIGSIQKPNVIESMRGLVQDPEMVIKGEVGRLMMLSGVFHPDFYHRSIGLLMACGAIKEGYSMVELGPSLGGHLPQMPKDWQPAFLLGLDNQPHIVAAAKEAMAEFAKAGLLDATNYQFRVGDHKSAGVVGDVAMLSLVSQYDSGEAGACRWLKDHQLVAGVNGDLAHSPIQVSEAELASGIIPLRSERLPYFKGYTGINWKLDSGPNSTPFGNVHEASLLLDNAVYRPDNGIVQLPQPGAELQSRVTIFERDGKQWLEPWAWEFTGRQTAEDERYLPAIRATFNEQYSQLGPATRFARVWDSNSAAGVPVYAREQYGLYVGVGLNTATQVAQRSGMLPLAMLRRNGEEVRQIYTAGLLSQIGPGKPFGDLGELYKVIGGYLADPQRFQEVIKYTNPLLVTSIMTRHQKVFEGLQQAA